MNKLTFLILLFCLGSSFPCNSQTDWNGADTYKFMVNFTNGTLPITKNGKWGLVDSHDMVKVEIKYDSIFTIGEGMCILKKGNRHSFINDKFEILHETENSKIEFLNSLVKLTNSESEYYVTSINGTFKIFPTVADYEAYMSNFLKEEQFEKQWGKTALKKLGIDSVSKVIEDDSISLEINYNDGSQIITSNAKAFFFEPPCFLMYSSSHSPTALNALIHLENRQTKVLKSGLFKPAFKIKDSTYLIIYHGTHSEVVEFETQSPYTTQTSVIPFGELIISHTPYTKNSYEVIHLPTRTKLFSELTNVDIRDGYILCSDTSGFYAMIDEKGREFHKGKTNSIQHHETFEFDKEIDSLMDHKLIRIRKKEGGDILISTNGKVHYDGGNTISWSGGNTMLFNSRSFHGTKVGIYNIESDSISFFKCEDIQYLNSDLFAVKMFTQRVNDSKWLFIDQNGKTKIKKYFNSVRISEFHNSSDFIVRATIEDSIFFYDKNLNQVEVPFDKKLLPNSITTMYSEWADGNFSFKRLLDKENKTNKGIIDSSLNTIHLEDGKYIYYNPKGEYFFIVNSQGVFGYMRSNGKKLY